MTEKLKKVFLGKGTENEVNFRLILVFLIVNVIFALVNFDFDDQGTPLLEGLWNGAKVSLQSSVYWSLITLESFGKYYILLPINNYNKKKCRRLSIPIFGFFYSIYLKKRVLKRKNPN